MLSNLIARSIYDFWNVKVAATAAGPSLFCCGIGLPQEVNLLTDLLMNVQRWQHDGYAFLKLGGSSHNTKFLKGDIIKKVLIVSEDLSQLCKK